VSLPDTSQDPSDIQVAPQEEQPPDLAPPSGVIKGVSPAVLMNYAGDFDIAEKIRTEIIPYVRIARDNRRSKVEEDWLRYRDIYTLRRNVSYYDGRSKLFIPAARKAVDTLVRIAKDAIFSAPYLAVETDIPRYKEAAQDLMVWLLEDQAKI